MDVDSVDQKCLDSERESVTDENSFHSDGDNLSDSKDSVDITVHREGNENLVENIEMNSANESKLEKLDFIIKSLVNAGIEFLEMPKTGM